MRCPIMLSTAGSRVSAATIVTAGIRIPARPNDCTNGTRTSSSTPSPIATVTPENTTARTAVCIVRATAAGTSQAAAELLPEPVHDQQRVVDRDPEPDQRHDVRREHRHVGQVRQREHDRQHDRDHEQRQHERHDPGREAAEHQHQHDQRQRAGDELGAHEVAAQGRVHLPLHGGPTRDDHVQRPRVRGRHRPGQRDAVLGRDLIVERDADEADAAGRPDRRGAGLRGERRVDAAVREGRARRRDEMLDRGPLLAQRPVAPQHQLDRLGAGDPEVLRQRLADRDALRPRQLLARRERVADQHDERHRRGQGHDPDHQHDVPAAVHEGGETLHGRRAL